MTFIARNKSVSQNKDYQTEEQYYKGSDDYIFPYTLTHPARKFKMPHCLNEISGLSYMGGNKLACIQDEKGTIYFFDLDKGKITEKLKFGEEKDYEDVEVVNNNAFILQSNGNIFKLKDLESNIPKLKKYNTALSGRNDAEGLAFDRDSNALLIACKDSPYLKKKCDDLMGKKAVYRFDLQTKKISKEPACLINIDDLKNIEEHSSSKKSFIGNLNIFNPRKRDFNFRPSGIAIHPKTNDIYIISSADRMLIVMDRKGDIIAAKKLDKKIFKQPEGICFSPEGDLFISNEKNGSKANILMFNYEKQVKSS
ncbi:MAG: SdiA-regulated domain-containing protein [bacterium]